MSERSEKSRGSITPAGSSCSESVKEEEAINSQRRGPEVNVDKLTAKLFRSVEESHYINVSMTEDEIAATIIRSRAVFLEQPMFLELQVPVCICGDVHGQFGDLVRIFKINGFPPKANYLFLGDYVDRGRNSLETIMLLLLLKIRHPDNFFLLRGNHETTEINRVYGFYDEMTRRFPVGVGQRLWKSFQDVFMVMPVAALVGDKVLCMHGGIPRGLDPTYQRWSEIEYIRRPCEDTADGIVCDLLWADPSKKNGWSPNGRGVSWLFGPDVLKQFCDDKGIDLVCRAHQVVEDGYELTKDSDGRIRLATIFSAPNYCGQYSNKGGLLKIDKQMRCSFKVLKPRKQPRLKITLKGVADRVPSTRER